MRGCLENDVRLKYPAVARGADYARSATSAIKGFCITCSGGARKEVAECTNQVCWLWRFRPYGDRERPEGIVPTGTQLDELTKSRGGTEALRKYREENP